MNCNPLEVTAGRNLRPAEIFIIWAVLLSDAAPTPAALADTTRLSLRSVRRIIHRLVERGLLVELGKETVGFAVTPNSLPLPITVSEYSTTFERFWQALPPMARSRSEGKSRTFKVWISMGGEHIHEQIMAGLTRWKQSEQWRRDGGRYIKGATAWLRAGQWQNPPPKNGILQNAPEGWGETQYSVEN